MPHMLEAGVILHCYHGMFRLRRAPLIAAFLPTLLVFIVAASAMLVRKVCWPFVFVRSAILFSCQHAFSPTALYVAARTY